MNAQITIVLKDKENKIFAPCDTVRTRVMIRSLPETCKDGMKRTKIFVSGMEVIDKTEWKQTGKGLFEKDLTLKIHEKETVKPKLTVRRKTDKEEYFKQLILNVK